MTPKLAVHPNTRPGTYIQTTPAEDPPHSQFVKKLLKQLHSVSQALNNSMWELLV